MAITPFAFDPPNGWNDSVVFPTYETSEIKVRSDMQKLHDQTRDFINNVVVTQVNRNILLISVTVSSLPKTISNAAITANHVLLHAELGTPSAKVGDWTFTTSNGSVKITGTVSGSTTLKFVLGASESGA